MWSVFVEVCGLWVMVRKDFVCVLWWQTPTKLVDTPMRVTSTKPRLRVVRKRRKKERPKRQVSHLSVNSIWFLGVCNDHCGVLAPHNFKGHVHEHHGHKTNSSPGHEEKREEEEKSRERTTETEGNIFCCNSLVALWWSPRFKSLDLAQTAVIWFLMEMLV